MHPDVEAWQPWRPRQVRELLEGCQAPWLVAAGWALDLHLGAQHREHGDIEIAVPRQDFDTLRPYLAGFDLYAAGGGQVVPLTAESLEHTRQVWVGDGVVWRLDCFLDPGDATTWVSFRDLRITRPFADVARRSSDGVPYQAPEVVLLMKAKRPRPKDVGDFQRVLPTLDQRALAWLAEALQTAHPGHPWIGPVLERTVA